MSQKEKTKFRASSKWKKYRLSRKKEDKVDYVTQRPLLKGFNLHHLDLDEKHYCDISDNGNFECLNKQTHEFIHWLYRYYPKDPEILDRIKIMLDKMCGINNH